jgi:hypothetical protein
MDRRTSILVGGALVCLGALCLVLSLAASLLGFSVLGFAARFWPVFVAAVGLLLVAPPILVRGKRGLGALFIPGVPILVTSGILLLASVFDAWEIWTWLWPMEVLSLALGFVVAGVYMRLIWLLIPATIIGLNGLVFQFCAISGLWNWWSVLWVIEPLSVGLALLAIGVRKGTSGLVTAGLILCGVALAGFLLMITVLGGWWPLRLLGAVALILVGVGVLVWGTAGRRLLPSSAME